MKRTTILLGLALASFAVAQLEVLRDGRLTLENYGPFGMKTAGNNLSFSAEAIPGGRLKATIEAQGMTLYTKKIIGTSERKSQRLPFELRTAFLSGPLRVIQKSALQNADLTAASGSLLQTTTSRVVTVTGKTVGTIDRFPVDSKGASQISFTGTGGTFKFNLVKNKADLFSASSSGGVFVKIFAFQEAKMVRPPEVTARGNSFTYLKKGSGAEVTLTGNVSVDGASGSGVLGKISNAKSAVFMLDDKNEITGMNVTGTPVKTEIVPGPPVVGGTARGKQV